MSTASKSSSLPSLEQLDTLIKSGDLANARKLIRSINRNDLSRQELSAYAGLANRVYEPKMAYRFLHAVLRGTKAAKSPTALEKIEYAEALRGLGLVQESLGLLQEIDASELPVADLRRGFCYMTQWRYAEAIPCMKSYLSKVDPTSYAATIARVNLAAALVIHRKDDEALDLLSTLRSETKTSGHLLLHGNCLELTAQLFILQGKHSLADEIFAEAAVLLVKAPSRYAIYFKKWQAISKSLRAGEVDPALEDCRQSAIEDSDWETVRDCDLFIGAVTKDRNLLGKVYHGTPYDSYRQRILDLIGEKALPQSEYVWNPKPEHAVVTVFDLINGAFEGDANGALDRGQLMHRMFLLLAKDFYKPLSVGSAFSELFPDEHFFQMGSTNRVCQVIKRLREWLLAHGNHFTIEEKDSAYRLVAAPGVGLRVRTFSENLSSQSVTWESFKTKIQGSEYFTRQDVEAALNCSRTGASRLLLWSVETRHCEVVGAGRQRKYRLAG